MKRMKRLKKGKSFNVKMDGVSPAPGTLTPMPAKKPKKLKGGGKVKGC